MKIKTLNINVSKPKKDNPKPKKDDPKPKKRGTIKIYCDKLMYSPFDFPEYVEYFKKEGFVLTKNKNKANIVMSSYLNILKKYSSSMKLFLWTHEPYHDFTTKSIIKLGNKTIHVMNVYTEDVFINNYRYFRWVNHLPTVKPAAISSCDSIIIGEDGTNIRVFNRKSVALSTLYPPSYYKDNSYTLLPTRYQIINYGLKNNLVDVYGKGWEGVEKANSRTSKNKHNEKSEILRNYSFNIAIENTDYPHYITEKIWEPIASHVLPIYYSNETIYDDFPRNSFIDFKDFLKYSDPVDKLFEYLQNISIDEYCHRLNLCIQTFNQIVSNAPHKLLECSKNTNLSLVDYSQSVPPLLNTLNKLR